MLFFNRGVYILKLKTCVFTYINCLILPLLIIIYEQKASRRSDGRLF